MKKSFVVSLFTLAVATVGYYGFFHDKNEKKLALHAVSPDPVPKVEVESQSDTKELTTCIAIPKQDARKPYVAQDYHLGITCQKKELRNYDMPVQGNIPAC